MLALRDLQGGFRQALCGEAGPALLAEIAEDGLAAGARLDLYRHHVLTTLTDVLRAAYPVVCRLVDPRFFAYAADHYIRGHLPASPCLAEYGASFPLFLAGFPPCRHLAYLPDVARLEWALHAARHADELPALDPARLAAVPAEQTPWISLRLDPSVSYLRSPWPVDRIWRDHRTEAGAGPPVDLGSGGARLEIRRRGDDVAYRPLDAPTWAFRDALAQGRPLGDAAERALALQPEFPLAQALHDVLEEGIAGDLEISPPHTEASP
jgi:hypothetical protein